jgi:hypothetical protein
VAYKTSCGLKVIFSCQKKKAKQIISLRLSPRVLSDNLLEINATIRHVTGIITAPDVAVKSERE